MDIRQLGKKLYNQVMSNSFLKSVLTLSSGVVVGQIINFLGMPIIGRIYTPAVMGDYTVITSNAGVISSVACLGMMTAFMLPEKDEEARGLSRLVTFSTMAISAVAVLLLWLCNGFYRIFQTEETPYSFSLMILWIYIVVSTISNICYAYVNRRKLYRVMFWNPVITAGINVGCGVLFGLWDWGFVGYTAAHILSFAANILHLIRHANPYESISNSAYRCIPLLKSYRRFLVYQMPANFISSVGQQIPIQMLETLFNSAALGMYSMAQRILSLPVSLLAAPINRVYFQEASQRYNRGEDIGIFSYKILKTNVKFAILPIAVLVIFGEWIFAFFLGEQWREAGTYAAVLGIYQLIRFCAQCLSGNFVIIRKNKFNLYNSVLTVAQGVLGVMLTYAFHLDALEGVALISLMDIVCIVLFQSIYLKLTGFPPSKYFKFIAIYICLPIVLSWVARILIFG